MIAIPANFMLLDEPTNHLDMHSQEVLQEAMRQYDGTIVVVSHNRYFLDCFVNKVLQIRDGQAVLFEGTVSEYIERQRDSGETNVSTQAAVNADKSSSAASQDSKKDKRRREAQRRQKRQQIAGPWLKKLAEAEGKVEELESFKIELEAELADPQLYQDQAAWGKVSRNYNDCKRRLERWLGRWEEAQARIDQIDQDQDY
jgi:ATP-binding cassette subfamily F protein 3